MATRRNVIGNFESGIAYFPLVHCAGLYVIWVYSEIYTKSVQYPIIYTFYRSTYINPNNCDMIQNWKMPHTLYFYFSRKMARLLLETGADFMATTDTGGDRGGHMKILNIQSSFGPNVLSDVKYRIPWTEVTGSTWLKNDRIPWPEITGSPGRK